MTGHPTRDILMLVAAAPLLLSACADDTSARTRDESPSSPSPSATENTTAAGQPWELLSDQPEDAQLPAGAYGLTANGVSDQVVVVRAPEGYGHYGGWTFSAGRPFRAGPPSGSSTSTASASCSPGWPNAVSRGRRGAR